MRLKHRDHTPNGGFVFYFEHPETKVEVRVPGPGKTCNGLAQLTRVAAATLKANGMEVPPDLAVIVEHQICLRQPKPLDVCFSSGAGDDLHHKVMKPLLNRVAAAAEKVHAGGVARVARKIGGCSGCAGRKTYQQNANNLGRAGLLNKLNSGRFVSNADYNRSKQRG